ncbi:hypothetical protein [Streptomyces sp. NPDC001070]
MPVTARAEAQGIHDHGDGVGDFAFTLAVAVPADQGCPGRAVAEAWHQFAGACAGVGRQGVAGVPKIMKAQALAAP